MTLSFITDPFIWAPALLPLIIVLYWTRKNHSRLPYPPGPKGLPILGNVFDLPTSDQWVTVQEWGKKYGPLVFIKNVGKPYLFLNDYKTMVDLLEKRGNIYSSRPENVAIKLEGWDSWFIAMFNYGDELQRARQLLHHFFQVSRVEDYYEVQTYSTHKLLDSLIQNPEDFSRHIRTWAGRIIMKITYGYDVQDTDDPFVEIAENGLNAFHIAEGIFILNAFPWLRILPKFRNLLEGGRNASSDMRLKPHNYSKKNVLSGKAGPSISSKLIEANLEADGSIKDEYLISNVTGIIYAAGSHTTVAALLTAILALLLHPEVQKRAHEELDRVVGKNNLPTIKDRPNLPYIEAIFKESFRWQAVTPLGLAHTVTEDDEYNGYCIPAGTTIFANVWGTLRDPQMYPEPEKFIPERWLTVPKGKDPPLPSNKMGFGFGRRLCPGRHFAENSVFIAISSILATFRLDMEVGEDNVPIPPPVDYVSDFVRQPKPFKCIFSPRSKSVSSLISQEVEIPRE